jgi:hypothetical protein
LPHYFLLGGTLVNSQESVPGVTDQNKVNHLLLEIWVLADAVSLRVHVLHLHFKRSEFFSEAWALDWHSEFGFFEQRKHLMFEALDHIGELLNNIWKEFWMRDDGVDTGLETEDAKKIQ